MNKDRELISSVPQAVFHVNDTGGFSCIPIGDDFKIDGSLTISAGNLRIVANNILKMLDEGGKYEWQ